MRLPVRLKFTDLLEIIKRADDPDKIPYQLNTTLHLRTPLGEMSVPVEKSAVLSIPVVLAIRTLLATKQHVILPILRLRIAKNHSMTCEHSDPEDEPIPTIQARRTSW